MDQYTDTNEKLKYLDDVLSQETDENIINQEFVRLFPKNDPILITDFDNNIIGISLSDPLCWKTFLHSIRNVLYPELDELANNYDLLINKVNKILKNYNANWQPDTKQLIFDSISDKIHFVKKFDNSEWLM